MSLFFFQAAVVGLDVNLDLIANIIRYKDEVLMAPRKAMLHLLLCDKKGYTLF